MDECNRGYKMFWQLIKSLVQLLPDRLYIQAKYFYHFKRFANLRNPQTYNEKLQWLKLYNRKPEYVNMVDKYEAKKIVASIIGPEYVVPAYGVWNSFEEINFDELPSQFVLKTTHDCGGIVVCKDKSKFDKIAARDFLESHLKRNYYAEGRDWPYKNVKPRILAEKFMEDEETQELRDYKFFTFNGKVKMLFIASDRQSEKEQTKFDFFDENFNHLDLSNGHPNRVDEIKKPVAFDLMKNLSEKLSKGIPHVRVDFYEVNGKVYFGEMTFFHWSGFVPFKPQKWDEIFGKMIVLPK